MLDRLKLQRLPLLLGKKTRIFSSALPGPCLPLHFHLLWLLPLSVCIPVLLAFLVHQLLFHLSQDFAKAVSLPCLFLSLPPQPNNQART